MTIPVCEPYISTDEIENVVECVKAGWISSQGKYVTALEDEFARFHGVDHAVALTNGTAAIEVALHAVGLEPGDEVIIPSFTIIAVAVAVIRLGGIPRFVDVDPLTWTMAPDRVEALVTSRTKAMIVVHTYGHPADMHKLMDIARRYDLKLVEDVAEAIASRYDGKLCGTFGDVAAFSLYSNKLITTGEGGMVITRDEDIAARARKYINLYFGQEERFHHVDLGFTFRMTNVQAAIGVAQMGRISEVIEKKKARGAWYRTFLRHSSVVEFQYTASNVEHVYWMYCVLLKDHVRASPKQCMELLAQKGIGTRPFFEGLHLQPPLVSFLPGSDTSFAVTERLHNRGFYLPSSVKLTRDEVRFVCDSLTDIADLPPLDCQDTDGRRDAGSSTVRALAS